jgi:FkbM family methyltransferase
MLFYYGIDTNHVVNISDVVFRKCLLDDGIHIPKTDEKRTELFGDPFPNIIKYIYVVDSFKTIYTFSSNREINISIDSISKQLQKNNPKEWYNSIGKNIKEPVFLLNELHKYINLSFGTMSDEYPEQLLTIKYIKENNKVLEIGGNIGRNTLIIATLLNDTKNLVTLESHPVISKQLQENIKINNYNINVEASALSEQPLIQCGWNTKPLTDAVIPEGWIQIPTISFSNLVKKYNVDFDTLVADCEGALYYILKDNPDILNNINLIILENDFADLSQKEFVNTIFKNKGFKCSYQQKGIPDASWSPCFEFFYEVWQK